MPAVTAVAREFPGSLDADRFVARTTELLAPFGFDADNAIACVAVCRDELARPLVDDVARAWGEAFNFSSLAGLPTLGRTGFAAARSHSPVVGGRERFVFVSMPHIGVDRAGTWGGIERRGQREPTATCGALAALAAELRAHNVRKDLDLDDLELSLLRRRLQPLLTTSSLDIVDITRVTRRAILEDLERLIASADMRGVDYAVFSGVQVHTPQGDLVWPGDAYVVVDGARRELSTPER